ncbi:hypothetical protein [Brachyspira alvinipulli]|uniref:hypothetical protein n=1 Tax=Brachyspira alvinipulli TaxID=84379 RepID=UPI00047F8377|nr:hypothetical protein [Brachyspira alvinipulli]
MRTILNKNTFIELFEYYAKESACIQGYNKKINNCTAYEYLGFTLEGLTSLYNHLKNSNECIDIEQLIIEVKEIEKKDYTDNLEIITKFETEDKKEKYIIKNI